MSWLVAPALGLALLACAPLSAQALHRHSYASSLLGDHRDLLVYTPKGYDAAERDYPVLVLLHGVMGRPEEWTEEVGAPELLEALIEEGRAEPMLLVLPVGYGFANPTTRAMQIFGAPPAQQRAWMEALGRFLFEEALPLVEATYRVRKDPNGRALAGFSMGGAQALHLGLHHPDQVAWVGAFAPAVTLFGARFDLALPRPTSPPRLLWMACGRDDLLLGPNRAVAAWLQIPLIETQGLHDAATCREQLRTFLPLLFHPHP